MKPKQPSKPSANSKFANTEIQHIEHLLNFMTEHNLEEFEYSRGDLKIRLKKPSANAVVSRQVAAPEIIIAAAAQTQLASAPAAPSAGAEVRSTQDLHLVKSPIVGTDYASPSPGAEGLAKGAGSGGPGQTLGFGDSMKPITRSTSCITG